MFHPNSSLYGNDSRWNSILLHGWFIHSFTYSFSSYWSFPSVILESNSMNWRARGAMELNGEQKQTWPLNLWSLVPGGRENPLHNYRKKCKTELVSVLPRKDTVQWEGVIGDLAKSEKSYKALYYGAYQTSLICGHFLTHSLY